MIGMKMKTLASIFNLKTSGAMKKILTMGLMCAATLAFTNCDKQDVEPQVPAEKTPFTIIASAVDTKTANDGLKTVWAENDALNVFHAVAGTTDYGTNDKFTFTGADNKFTGEVALDAGKSYDWYALYPVNINPKYVLTTPAGAKNGDGWAYIGHKGGANQNKYDSKEHLRGTLCPLYGVAKSVQANAAVSITMKHIASVVKIVVTNQNETPLTISTVTFTAPEDIVGSYFMNFTDPDNVLCTKSGDGFVSSTATLNVVGGTELAKGASAELYIPIKPFAAKSGQKLSISVNGYSKEVTLDKNIEFQAGHIVPVNFNYKKAAPEPSEPSSYATTYTSNIDFSSLTVTGKGDNKIKVKIAGSEYSALKLGVTSAAGSVVLDIPSGAKKLHLHAVCWKAKSAKLKISGTSSSFNQEFTLNSDSGCTGNGPTFTLKLDPSGQYYSIDLTGISDTGLKLESVKGSDFRVVLFGVNFE